MKENDSSLRAMSGRPEPSSKVGSGSRTPKIAFFLHSLNGGGSQRATLGLGHAFAELGFDVHFLIWKLEGPLVSQIPSAARTVVLGGNRLRHVIPPLVRLLRSEKFDVLVTGLTAINVAAVFCKYLAFSWHTRLVIMEQINFVIEQRPTQTALSRVARWLQPVAYPLADHVVTVSEGLRSLVLEHTLCSPRHVTTIPYGFALNDIARQAEQPVNHEWFLPEERPVIVTAARLEQQQKDFETLLHAFALLNTRRRAHLLLLGDGKERAAITRLIAELGIDDRVEILGFRQNPFAYIAKADLFVLSSRYEGFGRVIVEALACGTPVVSTDCVSGPAEILDGGCYGWLVPVGDVDEMAAAMGKALDAPRDPMRLKMRAAEYSTEKMTNAFLELFRALGIYVSKERKRS
jgi:glycosyltransferase involved in cell wall biosynthesis